MKTESNNAKCVIGKSVENTTAEDNFFVMYTK